MESEAININSAYRFLNDLTNKYPDDSAGILKDIIVDLLFPKGDGGDLTMCLDADDRKVAMLMGQQKKIEAIKYIMEVRNLGLGEAKQYVESRNWPTLPLDASHSESHLKIVKAILDKIKREYSL